MKKYTMEITNIKIERFEVLANTEAEAIEAMRVFQTYEDLEQEAIDNYQFDTIRVDKFEPFEDYDFED